MFKGFLRLPPSPKSKPNKWFSKTPQQTIYLSGFPQIFWLLIPEVRCHKQSLTLHCNQMTEVPKEEPLIIGGDVLEYLGKAVLEVPIPMPYRALKVIINTFNWVRKRMGGKCNCQGNSIADSAFWVPMINQTTTSKLFSWIAPRRVHYCILTKMSLLEHGPPSLEWIDTCMSIPVSPAHQLKLGKSPPGQRCLLMHDDVSCAVSFF